MEGELMSVDDFLTHKMGKMKWEREREQGSEWEHVLFGEKRREKKLCIENGLAQIRIWCWPFIISMIKYCNVLRQECLKRDKNTFSCLQMTILTDDKFQFPFIVFDRLKLLLFSSIWMGISTNWNSIDYYFWLLDYRRYLLHIKTGNSSPYR